MGETDIFNEEIFSHHLGENRQIKKSEECTGYIVFEEERESRNLLWDILVVRRGKFWRRVAVTSGCLSASVGAKWGTETSGERGGWGYSHPP